MVSLIYGYETGRVAYDKPEVRMALMIVAGLTTVLSLIGAGRSMLEQLKGMIGMEDKALLVFGKGAAKIDVQK